MTQRYSEKEGDLYCAHVLPDLFESHDPTRMVLQANMASEDPLNMWPWLIFKELLGFNVRNNALDYLLKFTFRIKHMKHNAAIVQLNDFMNLFLEIRW